MKYACRPRLLTAVGMSPSSPRPLPMRCRAGLVWLLLFFACICSPAYGELRLPPSAAGQAPLREHDPAFAERPAGSGTGDEGVSSAPPVPPWRQLNFSSSAPHLFASVQGLLRQWGNTLFPNGHTIAAVEIPPYTLFYHGRMDAETPPSPEWLAFDMEMSYSITGGTRDSWLLTYQTTRAVRAAYFDGESATLMGLGQLDTQMLHLYGNVSGPPPPRGGDGGRGRFLEPEYDRARGLCDWLEGAGLRGPGWGFEGVVRMNAGFEMIWCDFTSDSLRLLTRLNITAPLLPDDDDDDDEKEDGGDDGGGHGGHGDGNGREATRVDGGRPARRGDQAPGGDAGTSYYTLPPQPTRTDRVGNPAGTPAPPNWRRLRDREPFVSAQVWGWFSSAAWHYGATRTGPGLGEARARLLGGCGVLSYYAPRFADQSRSRARDERPALNLTAGGGGGGGGGLWAGPGPGGDRDAALRQLARRRRYHHLGAVGPAEAAMMRRDSERVLRDLLGGPGAGSRCTGADWGAMAADIVQRTSDHLTALGGKLAAPPPPAGAGNATLARRWLHDLRAQSHLFAAPFLEYPPSPDEGGEDAWGPGTARFAETYARCRYRHTRLLVPGAAAAAAAAPGPEEEDLRWAVEETQGAVCAVLLTVGFEIEGAWAGLLAAAPAGPPLADRARRWREGLEELAAWLGWDGALGGCRAPCAWDERCYIPMWPLLARGPGRRRPPPPGNGTRPGGTPGGTPGGPPGFGMPPRSPAWMGDEAELWEPKCVKQDFLG